MKNVNCKSCKMRETCVGSCVKLTEYLNKEFPPYGREFNIGSPIFSIKSPWAENKDRGPTTREKAILTLDLAGFPRERIAKLFNLKRESVRKILYVARKKFSTQLLD